MKEKKCFLGYRPKENNVVKLQQYIKSTNSVQNPLPAVKPLKLNKKK